MLRASIERLARGSVFRRRLPEAFGRAPVYVSASAGLKYLVRSMDAVDPVLLEQADELVHEGDVVWDIGANVGLFSIAAAQRAGPQGQVIAFEPDAWLVQLLRRSVIAQPATSAPLTVVPAAIAASCDLRVFNLASRSRAGNFLAGYGSTQTGGVREQQTVVSLSVDWVAQRLPPPNVIKVDVEGAELEVLEGATDVLDRHAPRLLCEVASERADAVSALLARNGYRIYDGETDAASRTELDRAPWCTVALPGRQGGSPPGGPG